MKRNKRKQTTPEEVLALINEDMKSNPSQDFLTSIAYFSLKHNAEHLAKFINTIRAEYEKEA